mmetsp:Transcript_40869/g.49765  ORF Transcript_40869/g.49765 Transcript_40869/m.49765 type:complete len:237 (+) Transcript_40869:46-756(+)
MKHNFVSATSLKVHSIFIFSPIEIMSSINCKVTNPHIDDLVNNPKLAATLTQKQVCLKLLKVIVTNLNDPIKSKDPKYRQLRVSNEKIKNKLLPCPPALPYLQSLGFVAVAKEGTDENEFLRIDAIDRQILSTALLDIDVAIRSLSSPSASTTSTSAAPSSSPTEKLSEKQKARQLLEKKRQHEAIEDKRARAKNVALLRRDKYVRENDDNWTSGVSAACAKSGSGISTFRDRHGE